MEAASQIGDKWDFQIRNPGGITILAYPIKSYSHQIYYELATYQVSV
jgi:hypothetical protein